MEGDWIFDLGAAKVKYSSPFKSWRLVTRIFDWNLWKTFRCNKIIFWYCQFVAGKYGILQLLLWTIWNYSAASCRQIFLYSATSFKTLQSCKKKALFPINQYYLLLISKGLVTNISLVKINSKPWQYNSFCQYIEDNILSPAQRLGKMTVDLTVACKGWIFRHFPDKSDFLMIIFIHWRFAIMDYKVENNKMKEWQ